MGWRVDTAGCVAHVDVHGECYVVEAVECMAQCMSSVDLYGMLECALCCELLNIADM